MSRFVNADRVRLDLGGGDWVDLKGAWTVGDLRAIRGAMSRFETKVDPEHPDVTDTKLVFESEAGEAMAVRRGVLAWGGRGFCERDHDKDGSEHFEDGSNGCKPTAVTPEKFDTLGPEDSKKIVDKLNELNPTPRRGEGARP